jgi:hypothetical protein
MAEMDPDAPIPTLTRAPSGGGWRLPLVAVVVAVVALVGLTRLGGFDSQQSSTTTREAVLANLFAATPAPTQPPVGLRVGSMPRSPDGLTYADGIPTDVSADPVYRVREALLEPVGRLLLVGGWYHQPHCLRAPADSNLACTASTLSDVPLVEGQGDVRTSFIALDSELGDVGAHVVLAIVVADPDCSIRDLGDCQPRLHVLAQMWSGEG